MIERFEVTGLKELEQSLKEIGAKAGITALRKAGREAMGGVQLAMAMGAGVSDDPDGEHMRDSIRITTKKQDARRGGADNAIAIRVGPSKKHSQKAIAQEYGTAKQAADPFMRSSLYENRERVVNTFKTRLAIEIQTAIRKRAK
ncbi:HK97-gp10 family putative phage morphogenesis protein [Vibrio sp. H11]|uniref:HK97-gp10 family putative phage morphogenesis protein n=1 Tax=Vibrio sp. H11 TaxID=2565928 RepID=UPI0010A6A3A4|nr:HK97-gp10 family putative phage morphogenesis protein [Vibrio sp. H11]